MAKFTNKLELYKVLQEIVTPKIVITGSTALQMYGLVSYSSYQDLDLIVYQENFILNGIFDH